MTFRHYGGARLVNPLLHVELNLPEEHLITILEVVYFAQEADFVPYLFVVVVDQGKLLQILNYLGADLFDHVKALVVERWKGTIVPADCTSCALAPKEQRNFSEEVTLGQNANVPTLVLVIHHVNQHLALSNEIHSFVIGSLLNNVILWYE